MVCGVNPNRANSCCCFKFISCITCKKAGSCWNLSIPACNSYIVSFFKKRIKSNEESWRILDFFKGKEQNYKESLRKDIIKIFYNIETTTLAENGSS